MDLAVCLLHYDCNFATSFCRNVIVLLGCNLLFGNYITRPALVITEWTQNPAVSLLLSLAPKDFNNEKGLKDGNTTCKKDHSYHGQGWCSIQLHNLGITVTLHYVLVAPLNPTSFE